MINTHIAGLKIQFADKADLVTYLESLASQELDRAAMERTQKEMRYHKGCASAYKSVAKLIANSDI